MASISNPVLAMTDSNWSTLLPGRNPTGSTGSGVSSVPSTGSRSGQNPVMPPINLPPGAPASNPYAPGSSVPTFGANTGGLPATPNLPTSGAGGGSPVGSFANLSPSQLASMQRDLNRTYGEGLGSAIMAFLQGGAGFNQDAINKLFAGLQPQIERGTESLMEQFSTSGNRFGSGAQIGLADYLSQVNLNEGQIEAQMYEQSVQDFINTLMGVSGTNAQRKANSPSFWDTLTSALPIIGGGAHAASAAGVGGTPGSILDVIAGLGA